LDPGRFNEELQSGVTSPYTLGASVKAPPQVPPTVADIII
jgi:hypothetical protein